MHELDEVLLHWGIKGMKWDEDKKKKEAEAKKEGFKSAKDKAEFDRIVKSKHLSPKEAKQFKEFVFAVRKNKTSSLGEFAKKAGNMSTIIKSPSSKTRKKVIKEALKKHKSKSGKHSTSDKPHGKKQKVKGPKPHDKIVPPKKKKITNPSGAPLDKVKKIRKNVKKSIGAVKETDSILRKGDFTGKGPWEEDSKTVDKIFDVREGIIKAKNKIKKRIKSSIDREKRLAKERAALKKQMKSDLKYLTSSTKNP
jgi:hypothetical protein